MIDKNKFETAINFLKREYSGIRTGRASSILVENIQVEAYGSKVPLKSVASISIPESFQIVVEPWDKGLLSQVQKAILNSDLGINPNVDGTIIRLNIPTMTEDKRKELVKSVHKFAEEARIKIRQVRDDIKKNIQKEEKDGNISENERNSSFEDLDKIASQYNDKVEEMKNHKEEEVMTV
ncbi:ribosome recycling factor [Patescibacteria group bacterium]|nr:ribosome recycling factor [Patescibacteria group bacterium]